MFASIDLNGNTSMEKQECYYWSSSLT